MLELDLMVLVSSALKRSDELGVLCIECGGDGRDIGVVEWMASLSGPSIFAFDGVVP